MISFVTVIASPDLPSEQVKSKISNGLESLGLYTKVTSDDGKELTLPENTFCGKFEGETTAKIRDDVLGTVAGYLKANGVKARVMVIASNGYAWGLKTA